MMMLQTLVFQGALKMGDQSKQFQYLIYIIDIFNNLLKMNDDIKKGLSKKGSGFDKLYEDCVARIQRIKQKNDVIQKQIGTDIEESIRNQIHRQRKFIEKQINDLKNLMIQMEGKYKDFQSKNKLRQLKSDAQKQIQRNRIILKDLINKSFTKSSFDRSNDEDHVEKYIQGGRVNYQNLENNNERNDQDLKQSLLTDSAMQVDYDLERKILKEKNQLINQVEQSTLRINEIMNDMGVMVQDQGEQLDIISDELLKTNQNMLKTNQNLDEANTQAKKSKKKYICLVMLLILILLVVAGVIFFLVT